MEREESLEPSFTRTKTLHGEDHAELSPALVELKDKPLAEQGAWWRETAKKLTPFAIGKSAELALDYDSLGRYFNGTSMALDYVLDKCKGRDGVQSSDCLDNEALAQAFVEHVGFMVDVRSLKDASDNEGFVELCRKLGAHGDQKASRASVRYAVRRLRLGALLHLGIGEQNIYQYDYNNEEVFPGKSFVRPEIDGREVSSRRLSTRERGPDAEAKPRVRKQQSMMAKFYLDSDDELDRRFHEYLFSNPHDWPGQVHWVHAHKPSQKMVLALGQQHHLRIHAQGVLCRLQAVHPQHNFGSARLAQLDWYLMTFPAVVLDELAKRSLENYKNWQNTAMARARLHQEVDDEPPPVHVGVVTFAVALLWTAPGRHNTVISMSGDAEYHGKWTNDVESTGPASLLRKMCCQRRKKRLDGYEPLAQDEIDLESLETERQMFSHKETTCMDAIHMYSAGTQAEKEASFENVFEDILLLLAENNSLLRMGTHVQLACRILLTWTTAYVQVVQLYEAAISRMQHLLAQKDHPDKEILVGKVSQAKLEISGLLRNLDPFVKYVMPDFRDHIADGELEEEGSSDLTRVIRMHHLVDIENNMRRVMQELEAHRNLCDSIIGEYDRKSADKVNNILNFLTIITFLVMPLQILTGIYGMNFEVMPELKWKNGYPHYFVFASFFGTLVFATFL
eukprot:CAMPEP_0172830054 /NCGR_PEP_ID=MMETSP1075-20121228/21970_1 /TAXON_ID=2916 /ORGANISM="Ceratium fusus, Strain PA161109" /LENGTH=678 /DNA_ID=CAMNT_0013672283 /DNA_START=70 /DNA_END=2102 /DNA_ORIENTATION=+